MQTMACIYHHASVLVKRVGKTKGPQNTMCIMNVSIMHCKAVKNAYGNPGSDWYTLLALFSLGDFYFTLNVVQVVWLCVGQPIVAHKQRSERNNKSDLNYKIYTTSLSMSVFPLMRNQIWKLPFISCEEALHLQKKGLICHVSPQINTNYTHIFTWDSFNQWLGSENFSRSKDTP